MLSIKRKMDHLSFKFIIPISFATAVYFVLINNVSPLINNTPSDLGVLPTFIALKVLRCILDFERSRKQVQGSEFSRVVEFMRWFPVALLTNGVIKVTHREESN